MLLIAVAIGEKMGSRVMSQATEQNLQSVAPVVSAAPGSSAPPYGPDWKRSQALSAAGDPRFPDPRVPPQPLPTLEPTPKPRPTPVPTETPNPNIPIWRQRPFATMVPSSPPSEPSSAVPSGEPSPGESSGPP